MGKRGEASVCSEGEWYNWKEQCDVSMLSMIGFEELYQKSVVLIIDIVNHMV